MHVLSILTLIGAALIVAALAFVLVTVALLLRKTLFTLGTVNVGLRSIAARVEPLEPILKDLNEDLSTVHRALTAVLTRKGVNV